MNRSRKSLIYITAFACCPPDQGGKIRSVNILKHLVRKFDVDYIFYYSSEKEKLETIRFCDSLSVRCFPIQKTVRSKFFLAIFSTLSVLPYDVYRQSTKNFSRSLKSILSEISSNELVLVSRLSMLHALSRTGYFSSGVKVFYDQHDFSREFWRSLLTNLKGLKRLWVKLNYLKCIRCEESLYKQIDCFISVSEEEYQLTKKYFPNANGIVVKNAVDTTRYSPISLNEKKEEDRELCILGSYDQIRNQSAARFLLDKVMPNIWNVFPDFKVTVIGRNPPDWLKEYGKLDDRIAVTGYVDDERQYVTKIMAAPYQLGAGVKHKVLIGMAMGCVVVGTENAFQGINVTTNKNCIMCDFNPKVFSLHIIELARNREAVISLGEEARGFVESNYSWGAALMPLELSISSWID